MCFAIASQIWPWLIRILSICEIAALLLFSSAQQFDGTDQPVPVFPVLLSPQDGDQGALFVLMDSPERDAKVILQMALRRDSRFMAPALMVRYAADNITWLPEASEVPPTDCYWTGHVVGDPASKVVVSTYGPTLTMRGHISTRGAYYLIDAPTARGRGHVLTKLGAPKNQHHCAVQDDTSSGKMAPNSTADIGRKRRSISRDLHVEVMVTADSSMKSYHGDNLHNYILTLMSIVAQVFRDPSLGSSISIAVVKIIVTEASQDRDFVFTSASKTLRNFCVWQQSQNYDDDSHPHHYDVAVLLSRIDFCRSPKKCDTLGLADLGTMCDPNHSCAIVEDNGLSAAFTIAHELGHVLSLPHDDDHRCARSRSSGQQYLHVMARFLDTNTDPWSWSTCSAAMLSEFLDAGSGECLQDQPTTNHLVKKLFRNELPGQEYSPDRQCELLYGPDSKICPYMPKCGRLWCMMKDLSGCRTHHMPWADGTPCAHNSWCLRSRCKNQDPGKLKPVNGQWGPWGEWDECTRKCGGGIQKSTRICSNPRPVNGGKYCIGERARYRSCNVQDCSSPAVDFRDEQCAKFNYNATDENAANAVQVIKWVPKYAGIPPKEQCKLYCRVSTSSEYHMLKSKVIDGTPCGPETCDICVNGKCKPAGCDHVLNSQAKLDRCGVCGGDNSSCRTITGSYNNAQYGYNLVVLIPAGSTHVDVRQHGFRGMKEDDNYLALLSDDGKYILNGDYTVTTSKRRMKYGGTTLEYTGSNLVVERVNSSKPLQKDLIVHVLSVGSLNPPDIRFEYNIPVDQDPHTKYFWQLDPDWSNCSHLCKGVQRRNAICVQRLSQDRVVDEKCKKSLRPNDLTRSCGDSCEMIWKILHRSKCSAECGSGTLNRTVRCVQSFDDGTYNPVADQHCTQEPKPVETETCEAKCDLAYWDYGPWSECSRTCDGGIQTRWAVCKSQGSDSLPEDRCPSADKLVRKTCGLTECPQWQVGDWSPCSVTCGRGERLRLYSCVLEGKPIVGTYCDSNSVPLHKEVCHMPNCTSWDHGEWSQCSVTCGEGFARRLVRCRSMIGHMIDDTLCDSATRPASSRGCSAPSCTGHPALVGVVPLPSPPTDNNQLLSESPEPKTSADTYNVPIFQSRRAGSMPIWKEGPWGLCSVACGEGARSRTTVCVDGHSNMLLPLSECSAVSRPLATQQCTGTICPRWRFGAWSDCPVSCGQGVVTRRVTCDSGSYKDGDGEEKCEEALRPLSEKPCHLLLCSDAKWHQEDSLNFANGAFHWRTGPWARCSRSCGSGYQRRLVECQDETGRPRDKCDVLRKPLEVMRCNPEPCPRWTTSSWSTCPANCDTGKQSRSVYCVDSDGHVMAEYHCHGAAKPHEKRDCNVTDCKVSSPRKPHWQLGPFSQCSVTCGLGVRTRLVVCLDAEDAIVLPEMCETPPPVSEQECCEDTCPEWAFSDVWSTCSASCGGGSQTQEAGCVRDGTVVADAAMCGEDKPPVRMRACNLQECPGTWKVDKWSPCSSKCGAGVKERRVYCAAPDGQQIPNKMCSEKKPKDSRKCKNKPCSFVWQTGSWSDCSATCGQGVQTRTVTCHKVNSYDWMDPEPVSEGCDQSEAPLKGRSCFAGDCRASAKWKTNQWSHCSVTCGRGVQKRKVSCQDLKGNRLHKSHCSGVRPPRRKKCKQRPCGIIDCTDIKLRQNVHNDGEHNLTLRGKPLKIFCADMNTSSPKEYVSLSGVNVENFSEMFAKRLIRPDTCPYNGERRESCECVDAGPRAGLTVFDKVRLNVTSMKILSTDYRFSRQISGHQMPYGEAGDCYSWLECPQGRFSVDLTNTGLVISEKTFWISHGNQPTTRIIWSENRQRVQGLCGGYCGKCIPDPVTGLQLDVSPPS